MIEKASSIAAYGGGATAFVFGLTPGQWQVIGIIGGRGGTMSNSGGATVRVL